MIDIYVPCVHGWLFRLELCKPLQWSQFCKMWTQIAKSASSKMFILYWSSKSWTSHSSGKVVINDYPPWFYSKNDKFQQIERFCFKLGNQTCSGFAEKPDISSYFLFFLIAALELSPLEKISIGLVGKMWKKENQASPRSFAFFEIDFG